MFGHATPGGEAEMDRSAINRALAKAIAYKQCGKPTAMRFWAAHLVELLGAEDILDPTALDMSRAALAGGHGSQDDPS